MNRKYLATLACLYLLAGTGGSIAAANDPTDAATPVPSVQYRSPFVDYRVLGEDKSQPWIDANDTVRAIGGWRAYAKEAAEARKADAAKPAPAAPASTPAPAPQRAPAPAPHKHGG